MSRALPLPVALARGCELTVTPERRGGPETEPDRYKVSATLGRITAPAANIVAMNPVLNPVSKIDTRFGSRKSSRMRVARSEDEEEKPIPRGELFSAMNHHLARPVRHSA
jgi:hypothetical protein